MKIINKTDWDTKQLRTLIRACAKREGVDTDCVSIRHAKSNRYHGYATLRREFMFGALRVVMFVPRADAPHTVLGSDGLRREVPSGKFETETFTRILTHEFGHNRGLEHRDMVDWRKMDVGWADRYMVEAKKLTETPKVDVKIKRKQRVERLIAEKERKLKRLQNALKKLYRRKKYYERVGNGQHGK